MTHTRCYFFNTRPGTYLFGIVSLLMAFMLGGCGILPAGSSPSLSGHLLIVGSTALQPLADAAAKLFQRQHPQVQIEGRGGGSLSGLKAVTEQQANIGNSDVYADPAIYPDPNLTDHIVCVIPFTMIVSPGVPITSLTHEQIIDIFSTGKIHNWREVGGPNLPITPVVRPASSGTRDIFRKYVLGGRDEIGTQLKTDSSTAVRDAVAHTPGAIGYLALSVLTPEVHAVTIDGQQPTLENIEAGRYHFWAYEHMYTLGDTNTLLASYLDFMLNLQVQQQASLMGYIPIATMKLTASVTPTSSTGLFAIVNQNESEFARNEIQ